jgi:hypothetical protein
MGVVSLLVQICCLAIYQICSKVPTLGIAIILPELRLLIQQYFDIVDYTSLLYDQPFE